MLAIVTAEVDEQPARDFGPGGDSFVLLFDPAV